MRRIGIILAGAALALALVVPAVAAEAHGRGGHRGDRHGHSDGRYRHGHGSYHRGGSCYGCDGPGGPCYPYRCAPAYPGYHGGGPTPAAARGVAPAERSLAISASDRSQSASASSVSAAGADGGREIPPGVRLKRGAGAGWVTPPTSVNTWRATLCGWRGASSSVRTGAKQTSVPSMISHHSARVFCLKMAAIRSF